MSIPPIRLDDLSWAELSEAVRSRIAAASGGNWTLHSPVDPGITLLELHSWLLEQRVYWMDQVPPNLVLALMALLDERPRPPRAAGTVLVVNNGSGSPHDLVEQSVFELDEAAPPMGFTTEHGLAVLPLTGMGLVVGDVDRSTDIRRGRLVRVMDTDGSAQSFRVVLRMPVTPGGSSLKAGLLLELNTPDQVLPQWHARWPDEVVDEAPPAVVLDLLYTGGAGEILPLPDVEDGTLGLRRSGVIRFGVPGDWQTDPGTTDHYSLLIQAPAAIFSAPPRLAQVRANAVIAHHRRRVVSDASVNWLPLPGNVLSLPRDDRPPLPDSVRVEMNESRHGIKDWLPTSSFAWHGPADRVFLVDREAGVLRFGDGLTARVPVPDSGVLPNVRVEYQVGGGLVGNIGRGNTFFAVVGVTAVIARNAVAGTGGAESEELDDARRRVAGKLDDPTRAVTAADYEAISTSVPDIAIGRAKAAVGYHPDFPCIRVPGALTVFIVPEVPRESPSASGDDSAFVAAPQPDPGMLTAVGEALDERRLLGSEVRVSGPIYRPVSVLVEIRTETFDPAHLRVQVVDRLQAFLDPLVGGVDGQGYPFGEPLRPSVLLREVQEALGNQGTVEGVRLGLDGAEATEDCFDLAIGPYDLVLLESVIVRFTGMGGRS